MPIVDADYLRCWLSYVDWCQQLIGNSYAQQILCTAYIHTCARTHTRTHAHTHTHLPCTNFECKCPITTASNKNFILVLTNWASSVHTQEDTTSLQKHMHTYVEVYTLITTYVQHRNPKQQEVPWETLNNINACTVNC